MLADVARGRLETRPVCGLEAQIPVQLVCRAHQVMTPAVREVRRLLRAAVRDG